jgi:hypothetical protein
MAETLVRVGSATATGPRTAPTAFGGWGVDRVGGAAGSVSRHPVGS